MNRRNAKPASASPTGVVRIIGGDWRGTRLPVADRDDLSMAYTPGVARVCNAIAAEPTRVHDLTIKKNTVAIVTDGTAVLGLGDIGPEAALPVMEGKALLFKNFAGVDGFPICIDAGPPDAPLEARVHAIVDTVCLRRRQAPDPLLQSSTRPVAL